MFFEIIYPESERCRRILNTIHRFMITDGFAISAEIQEALYGSRRGDSHRNSMTRCIVDLEEEGILERREAHIGTYGKKLGWPGRSKYLDLDGMYRLEREYAESMGVMGVKVQAIIINYDVLFKKLSDKDIWNGLNEGKSIWRWYYKNAPGTVKDIHLIYSCFLNKKFKCKECNTLNGFKFEPEIVFDEKHEVIEQFVLSYNCSNCGFSYKHIFDATDW